MRHPGPALLMVVALFVPSGRGEINDRMVPPADAARPAIDVNGRGFIIHGQRTYVASGSIHYARVPHALWRDRLQRLQRASFNCVQTYAFWNFSEPRENAFDFTGDRDIGAFLSTAQRLGLYATVRPGSYVCAEWDSGGYPLWLRFKPPMHVRTDDPAFLALTGAETKAGASSLLIERPYGQPAGGQVIVYGAGAPDGRNGGEPRGHPRGTTLRSGHANGAARPPMTVVGEFPSLWRVASVVGLGILPVAEGNVAVPVGLALGLNPLVAVFLSVSGTTAQTLLVRGLAGWLLAVPRVAGWWERCLTGRVGRLFAREESKWVVLVGIPWLGGVPTALGARLAGMGTARYARWAISGLILHAGTLALLIRLGLHAAGKG